MTSSSLNYQISGQDKDTPFIILLHGLFGNLDNLSMIRRELEKTFNVVNIDLPDHGESDFTESFSFSGYADAIFALLDQLRIKRSSVLGHSLGGKIAMTMALAEPERIERLIVADIAPVAYPPRHQNVLKALQAVELDGISSRSDADQVMAEFVTEAGVRQFLLKSLYQHNEQWQWRFNLQLLARDYASISAAIPTKDPYPHPTLFIKGANSDYLGTEHQAAIKSLFPHSNAKIIQGTGHWLHAEKPVVFNRIVKDFLTQS